MCHAEYDHKLWAKCSKTSTYMAVFKLANRNILWSFLLFQLLVTSFQVWNFIIPTTCMYWVIVIP